VHKQDAQQGIEIGKKIDRILGEVGETVIFRRVMAVGYSVTGVAPLNVIPRLGMLGSDPGGRSARSSRPPLGLLGSPSMMKLSWSGLGSMPADPLAMSSISNVSIVALCE
jgi:hypothetical protein